MVLNYLAIFSHKVLLSYNSTQSSKRLYTAFHVNCDSSGFCLGHWWESHESMGSATMETGKTFEHQQHSAGARIRKDILQRESKKAFTFQLMASMHSCHTKATHSWHWLQQASTCGHDIEQSMHCQESWKRVFRKKEVLACWSWKQKRVESKGKRRME